MESEIQYIRAAFKLGKTLAVADQILIAPEPGSLFDRLDRLLNAIFKSGASDMQICQTLIQVGLNFAGRDAEIVGYGTDEIEAALSRVLSVIDALEGETATAMIQVVDDVLSDMKSVNLTDSLSGLTAERIEPSLDRGNPGRSFLELLKQHMRSGVYWQMIEGNYGKFGNDFARGLEYLRHYGFCQVSTNPVLAAKAFDEDPRLTETLKGPASGLPSSKQTLPLAPDRSPPMCCVKLRHMFALPTLTMDPTPPLAAY